MRSPTRLHETNWHMVGERTFAAGIEVAEESERLQQLGRGWCGAKFEQGAGLDKGTVQGRARLNKIE
jgi:hypothetical protein